MATTAGTQSSVVSLLQSLVELDHDAIAAYRVAIDRVGDSASKTKLAEFLDDHERHVRDLGAHLEQMGRSAPKQADAKSLLTRGKVIIGSVMGDKALLKAMKTNEDDTNKAYERAVNHEDTHGPLREILHGNLEDERRHRRWIEERITQL